MIVGFDRLLLAYRKVKYEAFRDTTCGGYGAKFMKFESHLKRNLERLRETLRTEAWAQRMKFLGEVTFVPKSIDPPTIENETAHCENSDLLVQWQRRCVDKKAVAEFRPVISASVEYMLVSTLWVLEVGHLFEERLSEYAMGNRLKRKRAKEKEVHEYAFELFNPYYDAYGRWQRNGLKTMRSELEAGKSILAITMDLKRFYHNVDSSFLVNEEFLQRIDVSLTPDQIAFTKVLLTSFQTYNNEVEKLTGDNPRLGLPVGLSASAIAANVLLKEFDDQILAELSPAYYGRYVDDVFLVLRGSGETDALACGSDVMQWLSGKVPCLKVVCEPEKRGLQVELLGAGESNLFFSEKKQRIFQLSGEGGLDLLGPIEEQIRQQSSEHRDMPKLPATANQMAHRALLTSSDATELVDALRKADAVSLRRSGFAMLLGDAEAYSRDLPPSEWKELRLTFFDLAYRNLLAPVGFFDFSRYYSRVLALMVKNGDWEHAQKFIDRLGDVFESLHETCNLKSEGEFLLTKRRQGVVLIETVLAGASRGVSRCVKVLDMIDKVCDTQWKRQLSVQNVTETHKRFQQLDWARDAYWQDWLENGTAKQPTCQTWLGNVFSDTFAAITTFGEAYGRFPKNRLPILFPTRKIPMYEIIRNAPKLLEDVSVLEVVLRGLRAQELSSSVFTSFFTTNSEMKCYRFPNKNSTQTGKVRVAVSNLEVSDEEWRCAAKGKPNLTLARYDKLNRLLDAVAECAEKPGYVLLPECCLPRRLERNAVMRTLGRGVSLIAGLEYRIDKNGFIHNEALIALRTTIFGFPFWLPLVQEKVKPAYREDSELRQLGKNWSSVPNMYPTYRHDEFIFGVLICSELTDMRNRLRFQGQVDALFVPEWNQDIESFSALVESAALDVHAYIVQANNRKYGDSRIRAPLTESFRRDVVRTKGGVNDYFVVGELEYGKLRDFQNNTPTGGAQHHTSARSPRLCFKPVPQGFTMSNMRK